MTFQSPGAILVALGPITIRWYGIIIAVGFLLGTIVASHLAKRWDVDREKMVNAALLSFVGGVLGARLYFVALSWPYFSLHPDEILATWKGGLSIHGGIIGGFLSGILYCHFAKLPVLRCIDIGACALALAQSVGRWGNFFNSEAFGKPVTPDFPLRLYIPVESRPLEFFHQSYFHPTFLYESLWNLLIFMILYFIVLKKLDRYPGVSCMVYIALYSIGRLLIEPMRTDSIMALGLPAPIIASAMSLILSIVGALLLVSYHNKKAPGQQLPPRP